MTTRLEAATAAVVAAEAAVGAAEAAGPASAATRRARGTLAAAEVEVGDTTNITNVTHNPHITLSSGSQPPPY